MDTTGIKNVFISAIYDYRKYTPHSALYKTKKEYTQYKILPLTADVIFR